MSVWEVRVAAKRLGVTPGKGLRSAQDRGLSQCLSIINRGKMAVRHWDTDMVTVVIISAF